MACLMKEYLAPLKTLSATAENIRESDTEELYVIGVGLKSQGRKFVVRGWGILIWPLQSRTYGSLKVLQVGLDYSWT